MLSRSVLIGDALEKFGGVGILPGPFAAVPTSLHHLHDHDFMKAIEVNLRLLRVSND